MFECESDVGGVCSHKIIDLDIACFDVSREDVPRTHLTDLVYDMRGPLRRATAGTARVHVLRSLGVPLLGFGPLGEGETSRQGFVAVNFINELISCSDQHNWAYVLPRA